MAVLGIILPYAKYQLTRPSTSFSGIGSRLDLAEINMLHDVQHLKKAPWSFLPLFYGDTILVIKKVSHDYTPDTYGVNLKFSETHITTALMFQ